MVDELRRSLCECRAAINEYISKCTLIIPDVMYIVTDYVIDHLAIDNIVNDLWEQTVSFGQTWTLRTNGPDYLTLRVGRRPYPMRMVDGEESIDKTITFDRNALLQTLLKLDSSRLYMTIKNTKRPHRVDLWIAEGMISQLSSSMRWVTVALTDHTIA